MAWPKLSETLNPATTTLRCQGCGKECDLTRWREHDEADEPTNVVIVICDDCEKIIEPHPRLYSRLSFYEPHPGSMPTCEDCPRRSGLTCTHPWLKTNGGPGLPMRFPTPTMGHINMKPHHRWVKLWHGPVTCDGKHEDTFLRIDPEASP